MTTRTVENPTGKLRFVRRHDTVLTPRGEEFREVRILQQKWAIQEWSSKGLEPMSVKGEWRDVPLEENP
jgi:hypothetical protein